MSHDAEPTSQKKKKQQRPAQPQPQPETEHDKAAFTSYYLQRATREFAEDLDAVRAADDFSSSSGGGGGGGAALRTLVGSLTQGVEMFSPAERRRVVAAAAAAAEGRGGE